MLIVCQKERKEGVQEQVCAGDGDVRFLSNGSLSSRVYQLRKMIQSENADLIHTTLFESDLLGRFAALGCGIPLLTSLVNTSYEPIRLTDPNVHRLKLWGAKTIDGWTGRHMTTHFHAITNAVKVAAVRSLKIRPERITVIERGRDPISLGAPSEARRRSARRGFGLSEDSEVLVTVGRQEHQKGQRVLLDAVASLVQARPHLRLLIAGREGNATKELVESVERLAIRENVEFLGHREDIPELLAAADLFVFPSLYEGLGGALIEAMAMGLPLVSTTIPAVREVVEENRNAFLVAPNASSELAHAISILLDDPPLAKKLGIRSREIFEQRFTLERSASRMIELYSEVTARYGRS